MGTKTSTNFKRMKLNKSEILIVPDEENGIFNAWINESGSHMRPAWKPLYSGTLQWIAEKLFNPEAAHRVKKVRIIITYKPKENSNGK